VSFRSPAKRDERGAIPAKLHAGKFGVGKHFSANG